MRWAIAALVLIAAGAIAAPWLADAMGQDPFGADLLGRYQPPSAAHPLGTDELGRDLLLRLLYGARVSLSVGIAAALAASLVGTTIGIACAMLGGIVDATLMRLADGLIALPSLPLLVVLAAVDPAKLGLPRDIPAFDLARIVAIIALFGWVSLARLSRAVALSLLRRDFVLAASALGASPMRIALRHLAPNLLAPVATAATLSVGGTILTESVLSFLGLGIQPPTASWGNMLANAQEMVFAAPLLAVWPGAAIFITVIACNVIGDRLQRRG
ncbi:MAG: ABC transporter permease [Acetobacteraceae bacterium]|nr:ABC transporter permease [Acetobacteraceae bacterium]